jgi:hypothetical protein
VPPVRRAVDRRTRADAANELIPSAAGQSAVAGPKCEGMRDGAERLAAVMNALLAYRCAPTVDELHRYQPPRNWRSDFLPDRRNGWLVIPDEIEQTVSDYAGQRIDFTCR